MITYNVKVECSNCGTNRPRDYHCINCNSISRTRTHRIILRK